MNLMGNILAFLKSKEPYLLLSRYSLAVPMLGFGLMKILGYQFHSMFPPSSAWGQRLDVVSGMQLTWAFLGYSAWLQTILGICEFLPAVLLLFRRTALMGAILMLPMTLSVCLINYAMRLWPNTQTVSLVLLALNLLIFVFEREKIKKLLTVILGENIKYRYFALELVVALLLIGNSVRSKGFSDHGAGEQNILTGDWLHKHPNEFTLTSERIGDSILPLKQLTIYFDPHQVYSEINDKVCNRDGHNYYELDTQNRTLSIPANPIRTSRSAGNFYYLGGDFSYETPGDKTLVLRQKGNDNTIHEWTFARRTISVNSRY